MRQPVSDGTVAVLSETQTVICSYAQSLLKPSVDSEEVRNDVTWTVGSLIHMASPATI